LFNGQYVFTQTRYFSFSFLWSLSVKGAFSYISLGTLPTIGTSLQSSNSTNETSSAPTLVITSPLFISKSGGSQAPINFSLSILTIIETNQTGNIIKNISIPTQNLTTSNTSSLLSQNISAANLINYTLPLLDSATLSISLSLLPNPQTVIIADRSVDVNQNSLVWLIGIQDWPFEQIENQLTLTLSSQYNSTEAITPIISLNANSTENNLIWLNLQLDQISLYATFLQSGVVDDVNTNIKFSYISNSTCDVTATLPHFWDYSEFAVVYTVAQERYSDNVKSGSGIVWYKSILFIAIVSAVGGAIIIAGVIAFVVIKKKQGFATVNEVEMK